MHARIFTGVVLAAVAIAAGCGGESGQSAAGQFNDADVSFARQMIPHHAQAVEMAELASGRAGSRDVIDLASRIAEAQQPEIDTMTGWLREWGADVPSEAGDMGDIGDMDHEGMGDGSMSGMMSDRDMADLESATGQEFDRMFVTMMIAHHEGAIDMARTELDEGRNDDARALAQRIIDNQQAEIDEMRALLPQG